MKKIYTIIFIIATMFNGIANGTEVYNLTNSIWFFPNRFTKICFISDKHYNVNIPMGLGDVFNGNYYILNDIVVIEPPLNIPEMYKNNKLVTEAYNELFPDNKETSFIINKEYKDFYNIIRLENERIYLYSTIPSPDDNIYNLDGIEVLKNTGYLILDSNMKVRVSPSVESKYVSFFTHDLFSDIYEVKANINLKIDYLPKKYYVKYIAKTTKIETITGKTSCWYYIKIDVGEGYLYYWIFGGFASEILESIYKINELEYKSELLNHLIEAKIALPQEM